MCLKENLVKEIELFLTNYIDNFGISNYKVFKKEIIKSVNKDFKVNIKDKDICINIENQ